jgi:hypothetical protein
MDSSPIPIIDLTGSSSGETTKSMRSQPIRTNNTERPRNASAPYNLRSPPVLPLNNVASRQQTKRHVSASSTPTKQGTARLRGDDIKLRSDVVGNHRERLVETLTTPPDTPLQIKQEQQPAAQTSPNLRAARSESTIPIIDLTLESGEPRPKRPRLQEKAKSDPLPETKKSVSVVDDLIEEIINHGLTRKQADDLELGYIYIYKVITQEDLERKVLKIGKTKTVVERRRQSIVRTCGHDYIEELYDDEKTRFLHFEVAEKIIQAELLNFKHNFSCSCAVKKHKEYFEVANDVAIETVQRWRNFCQRRPYDSRGKLRPFWAHRLANRAQGHALEMAGDHQQRADRWRKFTEASDVEILWFDSVELFMKLWEWRWIAFSFWQSVAFALLTHWHTLALCFLFLVSLGIGFEALSPTTSLSFTACGTKLKSASPKLPEKQVLSRTNQHSKPSFSSGDKQKHGVHSPTVPNQTDKNVDKSETETGNDSSLLISPSSV